MDSPGSWGQKVNNDILIGLGTQKCFYISVLIRYLKEMGLKNNNFTECFLNKKYLAKEFFLRH